jgi:hypothetical protein
MNIITLKLKVFELKFWYTYEVRGLFFFNLRWAIKKRQTLKFLEILQKVHWLYSYTIVSKDLGYQLSPCSLPTLLLIFSMMYACLSGFRRESMLSLLSVYTVDVRGLLSSVFNVSFASTALIIANCSAWLFEHHLSNLNLICVTILVPIDIASACLPSEGK